MDSSGGKAGRNPDSSPSLSSSSDFAPLSPSSPHQPADASISVRRNINKRPLPWGAALANSKVSIVYATVLKGCPLLDDDEGLVRCWRIKVHRVFKGFRACKLLFLHRILQVSENTINDPLFDLLEPFKGLQPADVQGLTRDQLSQAENNFVFAVHPAGRFDYQIWNGCVMSDFGGALPFNTSHDWFRRWFKKPGSEALTLGCSFPPALPVQTEQQIRLYKVNFFFYLITVCKKIYF